MSKEHKTNVVPFPEETAVCSKRKEKFERGKKVDTSKIKDRKLKGFLNKYEEKYESSIKQAARFEVLNTEEAGFLETEEGEESWKIEQSEICKAVDITSASKHFELNLNQFGPYKIDYTRNGRHLLLGGKRGHVVAVEWMSKELMCEINVMEAVNGVQWLHSENMFAVAQRKYTYIYDNQGIEIHCLKALNETISMDFLPYHFLLVTGNKRSFLQYLDISVGKIISTTNTKTGPLNVMTHNPYNAVVCLGHTNGHVTMWSPNQKEALVKMPCHEKCAVLSMAVDSGGRYLATAGADRKMRIFDVRTYKALHTYKLRSPAMKLCFSQRRVLAAACQNVVEVFKDPCTQLQTDPYLRHETRKGATDIDFCPYEDVLGVGRQDGFVSLLVPGAGEPNYDGFESNPYRNKKQRREWEVKALLEKIQPDLITLDPTKLSKVDRVTAKQLEEDKIKRLGYTPEEPKFVPRNRKKGKNKAGHMERRKNIDIEKKRRQMVKEKVEAKRQKVEEEKESAAEKPSQNDGGKKDVQKKKEAKPVKEVEVSKPEVQQTTEEESEKKPAKYSALGRFKN